MKLRVVSSKNEITDLSRNEQMVHLAFRASNMDVMSLVQSCPRLRAVQIPPSYHETMSRAAQQFLEIQGVELLKGASLQLTCDKLVEIRFSGKPPELIVKKTLTIGKLRYTAIYLMQKVIAHAVSSLAIK